MRGSSNETQSIKLLFSIFGMKLLLNAQFGTNTGKLKTLSLIFLFDDVTEFGFSFALWHSQLSYVAVL